MLLLNVIAAKLMIKLIIHAKATSSFSGAMDYKNTALYIKELLFWGLHFMQPIAAVVNFFRRRCM